MKLSDKPPVPMPLFGFPITSSISIDTRHPFSLRRVTA